MSMVMSKSKSKSIYLIKLKIAIIEINKYKKKRWFTHVSRQAIKKHLECEWNQWKYLNKALRIGVDNGTLLQKRGSYRLPKDVYHSIIV